MVLTEINRHERGHDFTPTAAELVAIPDLYATEEVQLADKVIALHYFTTGSASDWWIVELDVSTGLAFGYACLAGDVDMAEWGYIDLAELERLHIDTAFYQDPTGQLAGVRPRIIVERDLGWVPQTVAEAALPGMRADTSTSSDEPDPFAGEPPF